MSVLGNILILHLGPGHIWKHVHLVFALKRGSLILSHSIIHVMLDFQHNDILPIARANTNSVLGQVRSGGLVPIYRWNLHKKGAEGVSLKSVNSLQVSGQAILWRRAFVAQHGCMHWYIYSQCWGTTFPFMATLLLPLPGGVSLEKKKEVFPVTLYQGQRK